MSTPQFAGLEPLRCEVPGCKWHIEQEFATPDEHQRYLDERVGHQLREHPTTFIGTPKLDDVMSIECPFKEESMRAAFYVGWLAARR